jgi:hypothetical protein
VRTLPVALVFGSLAAAGCGSSGPHAPAGGPGSAPLASASTPWAEAELPQWDPRDAAMMTCLGDARRALAEPSRWHGLPKSVKPWVHWRSAGDVWVLPVSCEWTANHGAQGGGGAGCAGDDRKGEPHVRTCAARDLVGVRRVLDFEGRHGLREGDAVKIRGRLGAAGIWGGKLGPPLALLETARAGCLSVALKPVSPEPMDRWRCALAPSGRDGEFCCNEAVDRPRVGDEVVVSGHIQALPLPGSVAWDLVDVAVDAVCVVGRRR